MEASLPTFAAPKLKARLAAHGKAAGFSVHAPAIALPLQFMVTGLLALVTGILLLVARPELLSTYHYNQHVIAVTHLFVLGWICTIVMGATYQLVPVALETKLYSENLARWQFGFHLVGFVGMVWMFWTWNMKQVGHFGCILATGVGLFVYNLARTLMRVPRWNVIASSVACAMGWLSITVLAGLTIAAGKCSYESASTLPSSSALGALVRSLRSLASVAAHWDQMSAMHAHAHLGVVGVFVGLIVGISYKLVPMFTLSDEIQSSRRATASVLLLNAGLLGSSVCILSRSPFKFLFALTIIAGLAIYALEMRAILRARKRRSLDSGLKGFLTALGLLVPLSILALVLSWPSLPLTSFTGQLENLYGVLGLLGVVSFAIVGMLYKIIPFLVWYGVYSRQIGLKKVPTLAELYSARLQAAGYWSYLLGLVTVGAGTVLAHAGCVRFGCAVLALSLGFLAANVAKILNHLIHPRLAPLGQAAPQASS